MGLGDKIHETITKIVWSVIEKINDTFSQAGVKFIKEQVGLNSINLDLLQEGPEKERIKTLKEKWKHSPKTASDIANDIMALYAGAGALPQLEHLIKGKITPNTPYTYELMREITGVTQMSMASSILGIIGEFVPTTMCGAIGAEIRSYLDYSGMSQVSGYGYGQILGSAISPIITQEMMGITQPTIPGVGEIVRAYKRELMSTNNYYEVMSKLGYNEIYSKLINQVADYYPSPQDFIQFAVRETFDPAQVAANGYDKNFPTQIIPYAKKAGMSEEWLKHYWRAHWQLPSPQMGFDMLHRGEITEQQLRELLITADYAPGWIERLMNISYNTLTRVDARRLYADGVLTDETYKKELQAMGYDEHRAQLLLDWTKIDMRATDKDLTKTQMLDAYELGLNSREKTIEYLIAIGYDSDESDLILALEDRKKELDNIKASIETISYQYVKGRLPIAAVRTKFTDLGVPSNRLEYYITKAEQAKDKVVRLPSKEDLIKWYKANRIDENKFTSEMKLLGFAQEYIDLYKE